MKHLKFTVAALALAIGGQAQADTSNGYGVATAARARNVYSFVGADSAYRTMQDSSGNLTRPGDVAPVSFVGCSFYPVGVNCSGSATGTNSTDYNLKASASYASLTDDLGYAPPTPAAGEASGRASLLTGELGVYAYSDIFRSVLSGMTFIGAQSYAQMNDTLTFNVAGANASTLTNIGVSFELDGSTVVDNYYGYATIDSILGFGTANAHYVKNDAFGTTSDFLTYSDNGWVSGTWDFSRPGVVAFNGVYALSGISSVIGIYNSLIAHAGADAGSYYGSTSHLRLTLPTNVTYTSASGVFLSGLTTGGAVPEPGTWAMMIFGFGLIGYSLRRRGQMGTSFA